MAKFKATVRFDFKVESWEQAVAWMDRMIIPNLVSVQAKHIKYDLAEVIQERKV